MAEKRIEIQIAATGAQQAAAEIAKVEKAGKDANTAMDLPAITAGKIERGLGNFATGANKVSAAGLNMRSTISNVGYQVQDFAVQVGMGTSAVRAFGQQGPQLLSAFGPWGIAAGTVIALGAPLAGALMASGEAAEESATAFQEAIDANIALAQKQAETTRATTAGNEAADNLTATIHEITKARYAYNESLQKSIDLLGEEFAAQNEIADAKGQLEIDQAEGDPVKQEQIKNRLRKEAQARELEQNETTRRASFDLINRKGAQQVEVVENSRNAADGLTGQADAAGTAALEREQFANARNAAGEDAATGAETAKGGAKVRLEREARQAKEQARKASEEARALRAQEADLRKQAESVESAGSAEADRLQAEMQKLYDRVQSLERDAEKKKQLFDIRDQRGDVRENSVAKTEREKADAKTQAETDKAARDAERDADKRRQAEAGIGRDAKGLLPKGVSEKGKRAFEAVTAGLQDGDQGGELETLAGYLDRILTAVEKTKGKQSADAIKIRQLEERIRNL